MEWLWKQASGELYLRGSPVVAPYARGYAGLGAGKNNPDLQCVQDIGPIPAGWYTIGQATADPAPLTLPLQPDPGNEMCGRSGFLIHADNIAKPGWASNGCIVIGDRTIREKIRDSGVNRLLVVR
jgi:hypothetical protein